MDETTVRRLNAINRTFYRTTADAFDQTRGQPWPGWQRLLPHLPNPTSVLDVGCGNGRLGIFLAQHVPLAHYHGVDNNEALLERAQSALIHLPATFEHRDIIEHPPDSGAFDLVALFGVLHHVPGFEQRQRLLRTLAERVRTGGMLAFACWRFYEFERFRQRIVPWPDDLRVEQHDYLLDWRRGETALRYCHYVDDQEQAALVNATGLTEIDTYRADGFSGTVNGYSLLRKSEAAEPIT
ncbi:MAG: class I SAM-dependent methyltransferase [Anaerolineae bacterium]|nr:class I SAM-dependent methyltransferase [Anaerolineae bacterium]